MSAKPYHVGHDLMIRRAAGECDSVRVFVSLSDRRRAEDAVPILGADMAVIWREIVAPTLPANVVLEYGGNPISNLWRVLGRAAVGDVHVVYADAQDLAINFHDGLLGHYCSTAFEAGRVERAVTERAGSGTQMRQFLAAGDRRGFVAGLPPFIDVGRVWDILSTTARNPPKVKATSQPKKRPSPIPKDRGTAQGA